MSEPREIKPEEVKVGDLIRYTSTRKRLGVEFLKQETFIVYEIDLDGNFVNGHGSNDNSVFIKHKETYERISHLEHFDLLVSKPLTGKEPFPNIHDEVYYGKHPIGEPDWEPKWGEFVKWNNKKSFVVAYDGISTCIIPEQSKRLYWVWLSELSKWEGDA